MRRDFPVRGKGGAVARPPSSKHAEMPMAEDPKLTMARLGGQKLGFMALLSADLAK